MSFITAGKADVHFVIFHRGRAGRLVNVRPLARRWLPGRYFGRRLVRIPSPAEVRAPLYAMGTAARIERLRASYERGQFQAPQR